MNNFDIVNLDNKEIKIENDKISFIKDIK